MYYTVCYAIDRFEKLYCWEVKKGACTERLKCSCVRAIIDAFYFQHSQSVRAGVSTTSNGKSQIQVCTHILFIDTSDI